MIRLLIYFVIIYVVYRMLRAILLPASRTAAHRRPAAKHENTGGTRRHAADFSDVQEAEFEDLTPPPPADARKTGT